MIKYSQFGEIYIKPLANNKAQKINIFSDITSIAEKGSLHGPTNSLYWH